MIGPGCAWCGMPAVGDVQVRPAQYRSLGPVDPIIGDRHAYQQLVRPAIRVPACSEHEHITHGQSRSVPVPRQRAAQGVEQLGMFASSEQERVHGTIYREIDR